MAFIASAALGSGISELLNKVIAAAKQTLAFKSNLNTLQKTLESVKLIFDDIQKLHNILQRPKQETDHFIKLLKTGLDLVDKCSSIPRWNVNKIRVYSNKLVDLDKSIVKFFHIDVQGLVAVNSLKSMIGVDQNSVKLDLLLQYFGLNECATFPGWVIVPSARNGVLVGLDQPLKELKDMLLMDDEVRIKVISAPGGCGKTTLATMLCHDPVIKSKFGKNIFFVTISKSAYITDVVKKIVQQSLPNSMPDIRTDDDAINHLECFLKHTSPSPILLVLDDVWPDGKSLLEKLSTLTLRDYKVLVTSRCSFPAFKPVYELKILNDQDAMTLFRECAHLNDGNSTIPSDLVEEIVKRCKGFPLALTVVGRSLHGQEVVKWRHQQKKWSDGTESILDTDKELLDCLQTSLDALDELNDRSIKDCCLDLGSFPEDQRIPAATLMDIWAELYNLDDLDTCCYLLELAFRNLVNLFGTRETGNDEVDGYCNESSVMQHDLLRDLTIHQSNTEPIEQRKRLFIEMTGDIFPEWWTKAMNQPIHARLCAISTDKNFSGIWLPLTLPAAEVVILNCSSSEYTIPEFIERMNQLKILVITNYGSSFSKLLNFQLLESLPILRRMRLERVSISSPDTSLPKLQNLQKISFTMCETGNAFENGKIDFSLVFPKLEEIEIDCCDDLLKLHVGLCKIVSLKKISITNCNELSALPEEIGRLENLEFLMLNSCTKLLELPESIGDLHKLKVLDISDCLSISSFPGRVGELCSLETINMRGCHGLSDLHKLPSSVKDLTLLKKVICDKGAGHLWKSYQSHLKNLEVKEVKEDEFKNLMRILSPIEHF